MTASTRSISRSVSAAVGSSKIRMRASRTSSRAISSSCISATRELLDRRARVEVVEADLREQLARAALSRPRQPQRRHAGSGRGRGSRRPSSSARSCTPGARRRRPPPASGRSGTALAGAPSISIVPASGSTSPASTFTSVLLPAPFSPSSAMTSPGRSSKSTSVERLHDAVALRQAADGQSRRCGGRAGGSFTLRSAAARPRMRRAADVVLDRGLAARADLVGGVAPDLRVRDALRRRSPGHAACS